MRRWSGLAALVVACGIAAPAWAGPNMVDVFDHPLRPVLERNQPKLILYASQATGDAISDPATLISKRLKDIPYVLVIKIDLRGVPKFLLGFARKLMQNSQSDGNEKYDELARAAGLKTSDAQDRVHVVMEADGAAHQLMGMAQGFKQAMAVVLDAAGREIVRTPFPAGADAVEKALREAAQKGQASNQGGQ